jgi:hypothetical protein
MTALRRRRTLWAPAALAGLTFAFLAAAITAGGAPHKDTIKFPMVRSAAAQTAGCLPNANANVTITSKGPVEVMNVKAEGLPPKTEFDFFVIQVPNAPFGLSWYQGDVETNGAGRASQTFIGRFNVETFIVAPGTAPAPQVHHEPIADAAENPATAPVHTYHIGIWFNSPYDAKAAGCSDFVTPFNGEHNAGVQLFNTASFPDHAGPLSLLK